MPIDPVTGKRIPYTEKEQLEYQAEALRQQRAQKPPTSPIRRNDFQVARPAALDPTVIAPVRVQRPSANVTVDKPNLVPEYDPDTDFDKYFASLPPSEQARQRAAPTSIAARVYPPTQAERMERTALDPSSSFGDRLRAVAGLPFASRTATAPPQTGPAGGQEAPTSSRYFDNISDTTRAAMFAPKAGTTLPARVSDGSINLNARLGNVDTSRYNLDGTANYGIGVPGGAPGPLAADRRGVNSSQSQYLGPGSPLRQQAGVTGGRGTGQNFTINRQGPFAGMGDRVTNETISAMAAQKRADINARRLSGAAAGGNILRDINRINRQSIKAYDQAIKQGLNTRAASERAAAIQAQADPLLEADRNQAIRQGDVLRAQVNREGIAADQEYRAADLQMKGLELQNAVRQAGVDRADEYIDTVMTNIGDAFVLPGTEAEDRATYQGRFRQYALRHGNYRGLTSRDQIAQEASRAVTEGILLDALSDVAGFDYTSMNDLTGGRPLDTEAISFFESIPLNGGLGWARGDKKFTLPGTKKEISQRELYEAMERNGARLSRAQIRRLFGDGSDGR